jgi:hypothetical protein
MNLMHLMTSPRLVPLLDWLVLALLVAALLIDVTGGFYTELAGLRMSARRTDRPVFAALAVLALRAWIGHGISPLGGRLARFNSARHPLFERAGDPRPADTGAHGSRWRGSMATLGFVVVTAVLLHTQLAQMDSVPDLGDPLFSMWRIGWVFQQLQGDPRPLFDANIFHPEPLTLTYSDSMLLPAVTGAPLLAAGVHPVFAYNTLLLSSFVLSALTTYLLIVRVTGSARAAFIGGLIYGFYPYRFEHYSHLELQMTYWMPLGLLALHRFSETLDVKHGVALALCGVAQLYSSMYYGVFFPLYAGAILGTLLLVARPSRRQLVGPVAVALVLAAALAAPLARPYLAAQPVKGHRTAETVSFYSATASDYLRPHPRSALYGGRLLRDEHPERALFPGAAALVLPMVGLVPPLGPTRLAYLAGLLFTFDLSRGLNGISYPILYDWFLPVRGMRVPARVSAILAISLAVLGAFGARRLLSRCRTTRGRTVAFAALVTLVCIDLHPDLSLERVWRNPPSIYDGLSAEGAVLAEFPFNTKVPGVIDSLQYMYFSLWHWRPMVNGYSGFSAPGYEQLTEDMAGFPGAGALAALRARGVTHVSVHCAFVAEGCQQLLDALDLRPDLRRVASEGWNGSIVRLYTLTP